MPRYAAFLRGINVSGQKIIRMEDLRKLFESSKFKNVATYIQSGNVIFDSNSKDISKLRAIIEKMLWSNFEYDVKVILRTAEELKEIVRLDPLKKFHGRKDVKPFVTFLAYEPETALKFPIISPQKDVKIISAIGSTMFCLSLPLKGERWGYPNIFIEKEFKIPATTRNWNTVAKVTEM